MKSLSSLLLLMSLSAPVMAQVAVPTSPKLEHSGSGNGSLNRDVLDYSDEVTGTKLTLESLEESFQQLLKETHAISTGERPVLNGPNPGFWAELTEDDLVLIRNHDKGLIAAVETAIQSIIQIQQKLVNEEASINSILKDADQYARRGLENKLKKMIKEKRENLSFTIRGDIETIMDKLFSAGSDSTALKACQSATCVDIVSKKMERFYSASVEMTQVEIKILNTTKTIEKFYNFATANDHGRCTARLALENFFDSYACMGGTGRPYTVKQLARNNKKKLKTDTFNALSTIHERAISDNN